MEGEIRLAHPVPARLSTAYTASAGRKFGLTVGIALVALSAVAWWRGHPTTFTVLGSLGVALILAGLVIPSMLGPIDRAWMKLALAISRVTTPVFMGVVYYLILTPVGLVRRVFGAKGLVYRPGPHGFWADRSTTPRGALDRLF
jgi:hypothetical protein